MRRHRDLHINIFRLVLLLLLLVVVIAIVVIALRGRCSVVTTALAIVLVVRLVRRRVVVRSWGLWGAARDGEVLAVRLVVRGRWGNAAPVAVTVAVGAVLAAVLCTAAHFFFRRGWVDDTYGLDLTFHVSYHLFEERND